jgi:hypothetical protein
MPPAESAGMSTQRAVLLLAALAAILCLPSAASAQAVKKFHVVAEGKQVIDWNQPRAYGTRSCGGVSWVEGSGKETFTFATEKKARMLAYRSNRYLYFEYNSWRKGQNPYEDGVRARGTVDRAGDYQQGADPGPCNPEGKPAESNGPYDCGTKIQYVDVGLSDSGGKLKLRASRPIGYPYQPFRTCPLVEPTDVQPETVTEVEEEYSMRDLLRARRAVVIKAKETIREQSSGPGDANTTAVIQWKVKLTPVK